ncbi:hypothetical protein [Streptomyces endophyticus]|uniref:Uncharacterized protein n=1 Tax=Streptomyces endophyticus TaxID=714166 RepID=A0ABU6FH21_9ACTN|nr:hypothetical protein [Streptomyces endophyticus]MEB8343346.1 hypothetical protein [Streptomyces endophyticus]
MAEGNGTNVEFDAEATRHARVGSGRHRGEVSSPPMAGGDQESRPRGRHRGAHADEA